MHTHIQPGDTFTAGAEDHTHIRTCEAIMFDPVLGTLIVSDSGDRYIAADCTKVFHTAENLPGGEHPSATSDIAAENYRIVREFAEHDNEPFPRFIDDLPDPGDRPRAWMRPDAFPPELSFELPSSAQRTYTTLLANFRRVFAEREDALAQLRGAHADRATLRAYIEDEVIPVLHSQDDVSAAIDVLEATEPEDEVDP